MAKEETKKKETQPAEPKAKEAKAKEVKAKEAKQRLVELEAQTRAEFTPSGTPIPLEQLGAGDQVEIGGLGMTGTLLEAPQGKKRVRVKVGEGELLATVANLIGLARGPTPSSPGRSRPGVSPSGRSGCEIGSWSIRNRKP